MKRFVDIRTANTGYCFAWFDTIFDRFETHGTNMAWDTFDEFAADYKGDQLDRYRSLCPAWAFEKPNEEL